MGAEVVLAVPRNVIDSILPEGFSNTISLNAFATAIRGHLVWGDRAELKAKAEDAQAIAYNIYMIDGDEPYGPDLVSLYQRAKTVGEELLMGDLSIGYGGHVDKATDEVKDEHDYTDFVATLLASQAREDGEEIKITDAEGNVIKPTYTHIGWINDNSNAIGRIHFAAVFVTLLPAGSKIESNEPNQIIQGAFPVLDLLRKEARPFENWSKFALNQLFHHVNGHGQLNRSIKALA